jgi:hypothetical protein
MADTEARPSSSPSAKSTPSAKSDPDPHLFFNEEITPGIPAPFARYLTLAMSLVHRKAREDAEAYAKAVGRIIPLPDDVALAARAAVVPSSGFWTDVVEKLLAHERELEEEKAETDKLGKDLTEQWEKVNSDPAMKRELHEAFLADGTMEQLVPVFEELQKTMKELDTFLEKGPQLSKEKIKQHAWRPSSSEWTGNNAEQVKLVRRLERANTEFRDWAPSSLIEHDVKRTVAHMNITDEKSRDEM